MPPAVAEVIMRYLAKKPTDRPHSASVFVRSVDSLGSNTPTTAINATASAATANATVAARRATAGTSPLGARWVATIVVTAAALAAALAWLVRRA